MALLTSDWVRSAAAVVMSAELSTLRIEFLATSGGQAPLTWGQRSIWRPLQALPKSSSSFNLKAVVALKQGVPVDFAASALRCLIERQQSLRAHFLDGKPPQQRVEMSGIYEVEVLDVPRARVAETARSAVLRLGSTAFDLETEWPARVVFIRAENLVQSIGLATSHVGTDFFALGLLVADFRRLLADATESTEPLWQPLAQAALETSPTALRRSQRCLEHWRRHLPAAPERVFATEPGPGEPIPFQTWDLTSPAIAWAAQILAERTGTSSSTVLLTASALVLRAVSRREKVVLKLISANRLSAQEMALVAPNCGNGIFVCAPELEDFAAAVVRAHRAARVAYLHASYDPDALIDLIAHLERERGAPIDLTAYFNDARSSGELPGVPADHISRDQMNRLREQSQLELTGSLAQHDMTYCITAFFSGDAVGLSLLADTRWLSADACQRSLLGFERLLCEAALRSVAIDEISAFVELAPEVGRRSRSARSLVNRTLMHL